MTFKRNVSYLILAVVFTVVGCDNSNQGPTLKDSLPQDNGLAYVQDSLIQTLLDRFYENRNSIEEFEAERGADRIYFHEVKNDFAVHCTPCHNGTGQAPFTFNNYSQIRRKAKSILESLTTKVMPPWPSGNEQGRFCNEQTLTASTRSRLINWIEDKTPVHPDHANNLEVTYQPGLKTDVYTIPAPVVHTLPCDSDIYVSTVYDPKFESDTFVLGFEFESSAAEMVHHYALFLDTLGLLDTVAGTTWSEERFNQDLLIPIDTWTKGIRPIIFQNEFAYRIPKGSKFLLDTHYSGLGNKGKEESCDLIMHLTGQPDHTLRWMISVNTEIPIEPNDVKVHSIIKEIEVPITVMGVFPHAHYLSRQVEILAHTTDGKVQSLVQIPRWDYLLQAKYMFKNPVQLPAGSQLIMNVVYDNTDENPMQPNDPIKHVNWGHDGTDEMLVLTTYFVDGLQNIEQCTSNFIQ